MLHQGPVEDGRAPAQERGDLGRETSEHLVGGVHHQPLTRDLARFHPIFGDGDDAGAFGKCEPKAFGVAKMGRNVLAQYGGIHRREQVFVGIDAQAGDVDGEDEIGRAVFLFCLQALGAPHFVWEYRGDGVALGWVWSDSSDWDLDASYAVISRAPGVSVSFDWDDADLPGAVLWFDANLQLLELRQGRMRDLTSGLRRRSAPVEDG